MWISGESNIGSRVTTQLLRGTILVKIVNVLTVVLSLSACRITIEKFYFSDDRT